MKLVTTSLFTRRVIHLANVELRRSIYKLFSRRQLRQNANVTGSRHGNDSCHTKKSTVWTRDAGVVVRIIQVLSCLVCVGRTHCWSDQSVCEFIIKRGYTRKSDTVSSLRHVQLRWLLQALSCGCRRIYILWLLL